MIGRALKYLLVAVSVLMPGRLSAQFSVQDMDVLTRIGEFRDEMEDLVSSISSANSKSIETLERRINIEKLQWNSYIGIQMTLVTDVERVTQAAAEYEALCRTATDSVASMRAILSATADFKAAEKAFGKKAEEQYKGFKEEALKLSLTKATTKQLERLKAKEQIVFQQLQEQFQKAQAAVALNPQLKKDMAVLEEGFLDIQSASAEVQAAEYKPIVARIKEYVMSLAAVALILMFLIMVQGKIKAFKAARENAKKYKEMLNQNDECPTI